ncbi:MAG TPA: hypothetical protein VGJ77_22585 [Gaiellaceae bacterium]
MARLQLVVSVVAALVAGQSAVAGAQRAPITLTAPAAAASHLRAFDRPRRASDRLPALIHLPAGDFWHPSTRPAKVVDSRRVATYVDGRGRRAALYVAKTATQTCIVSTWNQGAGAGCSPHDRFFANGHLVVSSGRLVFGVATDDVARIVVVGSRGVRHPVELTRDGGFIYDCKAYNGCPCVVDHVEALSNSGVMLAAAGEGPVASCRRTQAAGAAPSARDRVVRWSTLPRGRPQEIPRDVRPLARRVGIFSGHALWVAPTRSGWCLAFTNAAGGCERRVNGPPPALVAGEMNAEIFNLFERSSGVATTDISGSIHARPGRALFVRFEGGGRARIPVTYVSAPIDAGFFYYDVPKVKRALFVELEEHGKQVARTALRAPHPMPQMTPASAPTVVATARVEGHLWTLSTFRNVRGRTCVELRMGRVARSTGCPTGPPQPPEPLTPTWGAAGRSARAGAAQWNRVWVYGFVRPGVAAVKLVRECASEQLVIVPRRAFLRVLSPVELRTGGLPRELIVRDRAGKLLQDIHISLGPPDHSTPYNGRTCAQPKPVFTNAELLVSGPVGNGFFAHAWSSPSSTGGTCYFLTRDHRADAARPRAMNGGGGCTVSGGKPAMRATAATPLVVGMSIMRRLKSGDRAKWVPPIVHGSVLDSLRVARVEVAWRGGSHRFALHDGSFIGGTPALYMPPFEKFPFSVVAYDRTGREVARRKLESPALRLMRGGWKQFAREYLKWKKAHR